MQHVEPRANPERTFLHPLVLEGPLASHHPPPLTGANRLGMLEP